MTGGRRVGGGVSPCGGGRGTPGWSAGSAWSRSARRRGGSRGTCRGSPPRRTPPPPGGSSSAPAAMRGSASRTWSTAARAAAPTRACATATAEPPASGGRGGGGPVRSQTTASLEVRRLFVWTLERRGRGWWRGGLGIVSVALAAGRTRGAVDKMIAASRGGLRSPVNLPPGVPGGAQGLWGTRRDP